MAPRLPRHVKTLDSMRALSALAVFVSHILQIFWLPLIGLGNWVHQTNNQVSESAVIVFFLLSGYLITMSIWKNISRAGHFSLVEFAAARIARIYPPLLCAILVGLAVFALIKLTGLPGATTPLRHPSDLYAARGILAVSAGEIKNSLMMRSGLLDINGPLWSLYIEVQLYAAAGAAAFLLRGRGTPLWRIVAGAVFAALLCSGIYSLPDYLLYGAWWLIGATFFLCQFSAHRNLLLALSCGSLTGAVVYFSHTTLPAETARLVAMITLAYLMFFVWSWESPWLENVARFSYTLYLIHFPILILCYSIFLSLQTAPPPSLAERAAASFLGLTLAFVAAWRLGRPAENTRFFKAIILSSFYRVTRKTPAA